jgi:hypothetical protein
LCDAHKGEHENTPSAFHDFKEIPLMVNKNSREILMKKIAELIEKNVKSQKEINDNAEKYFTEIFNLLNELPDRFRSIIEEKLEFLNKQLEELEKFQKCLDKVKVITPKNFYTPLEKALIDPLFMEELIEMTSESEVVFKTVHLDRLLTVIPSNFSHIFSHYNYLADLNNGSIRINSQKHKSIQKLEMDLHDSGILKVSSCSVLITGGENREKLAFELDFVKDQRFNAPLLNSQRILHAMAWVDGYPAVIGGNDGFDDLDSIEVLTGNKWQIRVEVMKYHRKSFVAINHFDMVFVAGGGLNPEVYSNQVWKEIVLNVTLEAGHLTMFYTNERLLLFGGKKPACISLDLREKTGVFGEIGEGFIETEKTGHDLYFNKGTLMMIQKEKDNIITCKMDLT